jgi:ankyrin repeat protein
MRMHLQSDMAEKEKENYFPNQGYNRPPVYAPAPTYNQHPALSGDQGYRALRQHGQLLSAARDGELQDAERFMNEGADPNFRDIPWGRSPISQAAEYGHPAVVSLLLSRGVNTNSLDVCGTEPSQDNTGKTPLMWAAMLGRTEACRVLLDAGADTTMAERDGRTPLSWASEHGHQACVKLLLERGAPINACDRYHGQTPLSWAAMNGHMFNVITLLEYGADPALADRDNRQPLSWAAAQGHETIVRLLLNQRGVQINQQGGKGRTSLSWAAGNGRRQIVKLLLEKGADPNLADKDGRGPLSYAAECNQRGIVDLLLQNGAGFVAKN